MTTEPGSQDGWIGAPVARIDGRAKVTGTALYAADFRLAHMAHAVLATSAIAKGEIASIEQADARNVPGVLDILTYENAAGEIREPSFFAEGGHAATTLVPLASPRIRHAGQIVALIVAETLEGAQEAAGLIRFSYREETPASTLDDPGVELVRASKVSKLHKDPAVGNADAALAAAPVSIDVAYETPTQHHNPIELFSTTCQWTGDTLTVYEPSQFVHGLKHGLAEQLGLSPEQVNVVSPFVGGAFGSKGSVTARSALVALAARRIGRPVKLVVRRDQGFTIATYRAETRHRVKLGAELDGRLVAYRHDSTELTSRIDDYLVGGSDATARLYGVKNVATRLDLARADRATPGFMRSPPEVPYVYALESALDELARTLDMDPVELRRINDTDTDPITGVPYTSRSLMRCFDAAGRAFGWAAPDAVPASRREGDWLVGHGCAMAVYPTMMSPAAARVRLSSDGTARVEIAAHDLGTGAYTVIAQIAGERLEMPVSDIQVALGDSSLPPGPVAGGSNTTASCCNAVAKACDALRDRVVRLAANAAGGSVQGSAINDPAITGGRALAKDGPVEALDRLLARAGGGAIEEYAEWLPAGSKPDAMAKLFKGRTSLVGGPMEDRIAFAFGAEFVELRINALTGELRVPRIVGAFASGRIMNARTARSQYLGAMIWGISSALHEHTELDARYGRYVNTNLADYLVPVNADIGEVEAIIVPEADRSVNPLGIKGIGELANVGTAAAISNAVYQATGKRLRRLPIRIEDVL